MDISLIYVPYDLDEFRAGMGLAPQALKEAGLLERLQSEKIWVKAELETPSDLGGGARLERLGRLEAALADLVVHAQAIHTLPVILGGDCLSAIGVCAGLRRYLGEEEFGIAWFDAHGDFNTPETTLSGYLGGMPLASVCGHGLDRLRWDAGLEKPVDESRVMLLGVHDLDDPEIDLLESSAITCLFPADISTGKVEAATQACFGNVAQVYLHVDIDCIDPHYAPGVSFKSSNGISPQQLTDAASSISNHTSLAALTLAAINPALDQEDKTIQTGIDLLVKVLSLS
ncbi:MAG: arginase family protein [Anaerolineales bacterium]|nr:arginase family protein [Anaerolineales bacterium]